MYAGALAAERRERTSETIATTTFRELTAEKPSQPIFSQYLLFVSQKRERGNVA